MPNEEYDFQRQINDILKTRWNALEALTPPPTPSNGDEDTEEELPFVYDPSNLPVHELRYSSEYLLEFIEGVSDYFSSGIDVSPYIHIHRIILDNFSRLGQLIKDIEEAFGELGFENDPNFSELTKEEFEQRSELVRDATIDYLSMLPRVDSWLHNTEFSGKMMYLMFLVVILTMVDLENNFISEFLD